MERYREARERCRRVPPPSCPLMLMNVFELTRALVDIESITENEECIGNALFAHLSELAAERTAATSSACRWRPKRFNVSGLLGRS